MKLVTYANLYPGRLAARLLMKMAITARKEGEAFNHLANTEAATPAAALSYLLAIMIPNHRQAMGMRNLRELRTVGTCLDMLARGQAGEAADVLAQRFKALEKASVDGTWERAQYLELVPPEGASLLDRDEEAMAAKELEADLRLRGRGSFQRAWQHEEEGAGEGKAAVPRGGKDGKGKGKKGGKKGKKGHGHWKDSEKEEGGP